MKNYFRQKELPIIIQHVGMQRRYPLKEISHTHKYGVWVLSCTPTPLSETYTIKISYVLGSNPEIRVLNPPLVVRSGSKNIPHMYNQERLCVFYPIAKEWHPGILISETIVPWSCLWLYYYEIWQATGDWLGGGIEPNIK